MVKSDSIYQVLLKYDFDLFRGNKGIEEYLSEHLNQYFKDIVDATEGNNSFLGEDFVGLLKNELRTLNNICNEIPVILKEFDDGHIKDAYIRSNALFEYIKPYLLARFSWVGNNGTFYRIRQGDFRISEPSQSKTQKAELFHIKKALRNRIGAYRYSVAGYPCLYLASDRELAWFECGMPKQFSFCQMVITEDGENALKLVDFSHRPVDLLSSVTVWILNARRQKNPEVEIEKIYNFLIKYIITYPVVSACSVKVKDRGSKFVEEYIFPQLFMQWIRESNDIDGVRYKSSLNSTLVQGMGAVNVALPVKSFREDGLDDHLATKIGISDIGYLDVNKDFSKYQDALKALETYKNGLKLHIIEAEYSGNYVIELIDLCDCIIKTYTALIDGNYINSELIFTYVDTLCDHADLMYKQRKAKIEECIEKAPPNKKSCIDPDFIEAQFDKFHEIASRILYKHSVFNFSYEPVSNIEYI